MRTNNKQTPTLKEGSPSEYAVGAESLSVQEKINVLDALGRQDLIDVFKDWQPRQTKSRRKSAPLDQRVSITVTDKERLDLQNDLLVTNKVGEKTTVSQFVRNRAIGSVDINGWRSIAEQALIDITDIEASRKEIDKRSRQLKALLEDEEDAEQVTVYERELANINNRIKKVTAQNEKRRNRLSGRMSMAEAETVKWRAAQLSISTSDYLRFLIFDLMPDSHADGHMSLDAKKRFYVSIIAVAEHGWGTPPTIAHCTQCTNYLEEIRKLRDRVRQIETYV